MPKVLVFTMVFFSALWGLGWVAVTTADLEIPSTVPSSRSALCCIESILFFVLSLTCITCVRKSKYATGQGAFLLLGGLTLLFSLIFQGALYASKHTFMGGDVDPQAFLSRKTQATGGYLLLVDGTTYREQTVTNGMVFLWPSFSRKFVMGAPSIIEIKDAGTTYHVPKPPGARDMRVKVTLRGGVIHLPFNEERLRALFAAFPSKGHIIDFEWHLAQELERVSYPVFASMPYAPAPQELEITLDTTEGLLGNLEQYGFRIVSSDNDPPKLYFSISYPNDTRGFTSKEKYVASALLQRDPIEE